MLFLTYYMQFINNKRQ